MKTLCKKFDVCTYTYIYIYAAINRWFIALTVYTLTLYDVQQWNLFNDFKALCRDIYTIPSFHNSV